MFVLAHPCFFLSPPVSRRLRGAVTLSWISCDEEHAWDGDLSTPGRCCLRLKCASFISRSAVIAHEIKKKKRREEDKTCDSGPALKTKECNVCQAVVSKQDKNKQEWVTWDCAAAPCEKFPFIFAPLSLFSKCSAVIGVLFSSCSCNWKHRFYRTGRKRATRGTEKKTIKTRDWEKDTARQRKKIKTAG